MTQEPGGKDPFDPTDAAKTGLLTRLRIRYTGNQEETVVEAYRGDLKIPLDVDSIQFFVDCHGGKVTLSWPANCVDFEIDVEKRKHFYCLGCGGLVSITNVRCDKCVPLKAPVDPLDIVTHGNLGGGK